MSTSAEVLRWSPTSRTARSANRRFLLLVSILLLMVIALPLAAGVRVAATAQTDDRSPTDAIVVMGAAQYQGVPSPVLANRLEHARALVEAGVADRVITVGGYRDGDITSEAQAGKEALVAKGMPRNHVTALPFGANTAESVSAIGVIAAQEGIRSVTVVTDPAHAARAQALMHAENVEVHVSPTADGAGSGMGARYLARETVGLLGVWLGW